MALVSPGVEVQVVDESAYGAPGAGTVPLLLIATRTDKADPTGSEADGIAKYTKKTQAGKPIKVTSQRELTQYYGNPTFTENSSGLIIQGSETSEYGLMAAYSYLGQGNTAYVVRADVDLAQLDSTATEPTAAYAIGNGLWLDTDFSKYGIHQWDVTNSSWENRVPAVAVNATSSQTDIDGDVAFDPTSLATPSAATNGTFLVVVHTDNEVAVTANRQMSLQWFYGVGGAWELLDSSAVLTTGETVTYDAHYNAPGAPGANDIWIKLTSPGNGMDLDFWRYDNSVARFNSVTVQGFSTTQTDGTGAIGDFDPADGSSVTNLSASSAVLGNLLIDQQAKTRATIVIREIDASGAASVLTTTDVQADPATPTAGSADGTYWFDNDIDSLDLYQVDGANYTPVTATYSQTAPNAPSAGDIWIDTLQSAENQANERDYPKIYRRNTANSGWIKHVNTDQSTSNGVLFANISDVGADATNGGNATPIVGAPSALVYPNEMIVVNMAQSRNTVREWNATATKSAGHPTPSVPGAWRNAAANHADGSGSFGRYAQRKVIATGMQAAAANTDLRDPTLRFSLIAAPNMPELIDEMVTLNSDRGETAFIIVDSPLRKNPTDIITWVQNNNNASENGEDGLITNNTYSAVYYPSCQTTEPLNGNTVVCPASHMALYTYAYNDNISFQWFPPAGTTRGVVQNATSVGHMTTEGEFKPLSLNQGQRDAMYTVKLNPITTFPGQGTIVFGQKTLHTTASALDRVNVARLVAYLRDRFDELARPFLFEINDQLTRDRAKIVFERFLADILSRRGLYDFAVVCDTSNNTPARIDRNELYIDVAIEPAKAVEFIYIPIRVVNTGTIKAIN